MSEWIKVEDRLPEPFKPIISFDGKHVSLGHYSDVFEDFVLLIDFAEKVTHWMPLPEPPK